MAALENTGRPMVPCRLAEIRALVTYWYKSVLCELVIGIPASMKHAVHATKKYCIFVLWSAFYAARPEKQPSQEAGSTLFPASLCSTMRLLLNHNSFYRMESIHGAFQRWLSQEEIFLVLLPIWCYPPARGPFNGTVGAMAKYRFADGLYCAKKLCNSI